VQRQLPLVLVAVLILCTSVASVLWQGEKARAATSKGINFQARLMNTSGSIVPDGYYNVEFKIYDVDTGGTALFTDTYYDSNGVTAGNDARVRVLNGYLTVSIGSQVGNPFPTTINWDQELWLTMNVGGTTQTATPTYDGEMDPRLKLTAVPYAFRAGQLAQYNSVTGFTSTLSIAQPTGGNQIFVLPDQGAGGTYNVLTTATAATSFVQLQGTTPGSAQVGNFNINGTGIAGTLQSGTLSVSSSATTGTAATITASSINSGFGLDISTGSAVTSGAGLRVSGSGTAAYSAGNGLVQFVNDGAFTGQLTTISSSGTTTGSLLNLNLSNGSQTSSSALVVTQSGVSTGFTGNLVSFTGSSTTGSGNVLSVTTVNTTGGNGLNLTANALTTGDGADLNHSTTAITSGALLRVSSTAADAFTTGGLAVISSNQNFTTTANTSGLLNVSSSASADGTLVNIANSFGSQVGSTALNVVQSGTTTGFTGNLVNFTGSSTTGSGNVLNITSVNTTGGNGLNLTANALTTGDGVDLNHSTSVLTSGALLRVSSTAVDAFTSGGGLAVISSNQNFSSAAGSGLLAVNATASTTGGTLVNIANSTAGQVDSTALNVVQSNTTNTFTGNFVNITGTHNSSSTGTTFNVASAVSSNGNAVRIIANSLSSGGVGLNITSGSTGTTTGSLLRVTSDTQGAVNSNGLVSIRATDAYTSTSNTGLLDVRANSTTAGTIVNVQGTSLTTGVALNIATAASTGTAIRVASGLTTLTGATSGDALNVSNSSSTGNIVVFSDNSTAVATIANGGAAQFRNETNSATAFQVQNATGADNLFTINTVTRAGGTAGNTVKIGDSTGTDTDTTILQLDGASAVPTTNLASLNGGLFYNSATGKISIVEAGVVKAVCNSTDLGCGTGGSVTLQNAYNGGSTISTSGSSIGVTLNGADNFTVTTVAGGTGSTTYSLSDGSNGAPPTQLVLITNNDVNQVLANGLTVSAAAGGITDGLDVSDTDLVNAVNVGDNTITGTTAIIDFTNFDVSSLGVVTLGGGQTRDITTADAGTATALTLQPGITTGANGTGALTTLKGGDADSTTCGTACTGGGITIQAGSATGLSGTTRNGGNVTINAGSGATANGSISIGTATTSGVTIGATSSSTVVLQAGTGTATGDINIGDQTVAGKIIDIGSVDNAGTSTVRVATGAAVQTVTIGSTNSTSSLALQAGTGLLNIGNDTVSKTTTINIGAENTGADLVALGSTNASSTVTIEGGTSGTAIQIGNGATAHGIQIGTGAAVQTVTLGSTNTTSTTSIQGGVGAGGAINIGSVGSSALASTTHIADTSSSTGAQAVTVGSIAANTGNVTTIQGGSNTSAAVSIQAASAGLIVVGNTNNNTIVLGGATSTVRVGALTAVTSTSQVVCRDTATNNLTACDGGTGGKPFIQGGNSFGATAVLGTNDSQQLDIRTNGTTRMSFVSTGGISIPGNATADELEIGDNILDGNDGATRLNVGSTGGNSVIRVGESASLFGSVFWDVSTNIFHATAFTGVAMQIQSNGGALSVLGPTTFQATADAANVFQVQTNAGVDVIDLDTSTATPVLNLGVSTGGTASTVNIGTSTSATQLIRLGSQSNGSAAAGTQVFMQGGSGIGAISIQTLSGGTVSIGSNTVGNTINIGSSTIGTSTTATQTISIGPGNASLGTTNVTIGNTGNAAAGSTTVRAKDSVVLATNSVTRLTFDALLGNATTAYFGNGVSASSPTDFIISGTSNTTSGQAGAKLTLQGGSATAGTANGGNLALTGGSGSGTGVKGLVVIDTPTFTTASTQACGSNCNITQANIDSSGGVLINATATGLTVTLSDPTITTAGRIMYVTNVSASNDFILAANAGVSTVTLKPNTSATMVWNGSDWTAAGASSSTDLQAAYNNTASSAGAAELVLKNTATSNGLTVRNGTGVDEITGGLLEVQTAIGSNLFTVNNNATEYATNGGAETAGASASTFPASTWDTTTGGTVDRWTTAGDNIATGTASVRVQTTTTNHGARDRIAASLTSGLTYTTSFAVRGATNFATLQVLYSPDGTTTGTTQCATAQTVTSGIWTRISCSFIASGTITSSNSILIRQTDATARTFYIDNLSININASATFAADGSVDNAGTFATNWTDFDVGTGSTTITRETSIIYDTSASTAGATSANTGQGIRNNMAITPAINTQYLVSFYARASSTMTGSLSVGFLPAGGTSVPSGTAACTDYSTQSLVANTWTKITCLFTTTGTAISNPDLVMYQTDSTARSIYVDALSITLNTNNSNNVQVGSGNKGGPTTLFTLDRASTAPIAANNDAYLGSMYYDTTSGRIQCYEADGWGACGAAPDNIVNLNPEYAGAVLNGSGIGTMTADFCANQSGVLQINYVASTDPCFTSGDVKNYYKWTSPQATQQTYSIYVTYQLPATFNGFSSDDTVQLTGRVTSTTNAAVTYQMYYKTPAGSLTQCGTSETNVITAPGGGAGSANTWYSYGVNGNESTGCSLNSAAANGFIIFKINLKANSNASAFVSTLSFVTTGR
jgi:hypothetical protein